MPKSRELIKKFTTFLPVITSTNKNGDWIVDPNLSNKFDLVYNDRRIYKNDLNRDSEEFWVKYWLERNSQSNNEQPPGNHYIASYLEETVFYTAQKLYGKFSYLNKKPGFAFSFNDLIQVARGDLLDRDKFSKLFSNYEPERSSFKTFAGLKIVDLMTNHVFGLARRKYSDVGLLRVSNLRTDVEVDLKNCGIIPKYEKKHQEHQDDRDKNDDFRLINCQFARCILAFYCFSNTYVPITENGSRRLEWPNQQQLESIANRYNQLVFKSVKSKKKNKSENLLQMCVEALKDTSVDSQTIDKLLKACVEALRHKISPPNGSTNQKIGNYSGDDLYEEVGDRISNDWSGDIETNEEREEEIQQWSDVEVIIINFYNTFSKQDRKVFQLFLGLSLTQEDSGYAFSITQPQVYRLLYKKFSEKDKNNQSIFLRIVKQWSLDLLENSPNSLERFKIITSNNVDRINLKPKNVESIVNEIKDCLKKYISNSLFFILREELLKQAADRVQILKLHYRKKIPLNIVVERLNISESNARETLEFTKNRLRQVLTAEIQKDLPVFLDPSTSDNRETTAFIQRVERCISTFVDTWTENAPYAEIERELQNQDK